MDSFSMVSKSNECGIRNRGRSGLKGGGSVGESDDGREGLRQGRKGEKTPGHIGEKKFIG